MNAFEAIARLETIRDRIFALNVARHKLENDVEYRGGTGDFYAMIKELEEEKSELIDKLRAVSL